MQRDILPIVEGSTVTASTAPCAPTTFSSSPPAPSAVSKVSDLIPELRALPVRIELQPLLADDFGRILREPQNSLIKQYTALLETEGVNIQLAEEAITKMAALCARVDQKSENIGAHHLHTIMEYLLEDISFDAPQRRGESLVIDDALVESRLSSLLEKQDLTKYIL